MFSQLKQNLPYKHFHSRLCHIALNPFPRFLQFEDLSRIQREPWVGWGRGSGVGEGAVRHSITMASCTFMHNSVNTKSIPKLSPSLTCATRTMSPVDGNTRISGNLHLITLLHTHNGCRYINRQNPYCSGKRDRRASAISDGKRLLLFDSTSTSHSSL